MCDRLQLIWKSGTGYRDVLKRKEQKMKNKKIEIIPYLEFRGNCEEALQVYIEAFGGEILHMSRWPEHMPGVAPEQIGKVMHAEFMLGNTHMSAGDAFVYSEAKAGIKLMIHMDSKEEALHTVSVLAEGGTVLSPLRPHPEPDDGGCGSITKDRFGFTWIITCPNPDKQ